MASIETLARLQKRIYLSNLSTTNNEYITLLMNGPHGVGKSQVAKSTAKDMNGYCFTIECSTLGMGELTGLPVAMKNQDGSSEVRYIPHYVINRIKSMQKYYYEKAETTGFLNGEVKIITEKGQKYLLEGEKKHKLNDAIDVLAQSEDNIYEFGHQLSRATKLRLLESDEIRPVFINMDEINRCELQTMKEIMNFILNRSINGYELPWWVSIVASQNPNSQNSTYATNEMDDAQLSRFLKINVDTNFNEWVNYAMNHHLNETLVEALVNLDGANFIHRTKGQEDTQHMTPDPRAWEMLCNLYDSLAESNNTKYFNYDERKEMDADFRMLVKGKVGEEAGRTILTSIDQAKSFIKSYEILTGKAQKVDQKVLEAFLKCKKLMQYTIARSVCNFIGNNLETILSGKKSTDAKKKAEYMNYIGQIADFVNHLDPATQIEFIRTLVALPDGKQVYLAVSIGFTKEVLANITSANAEVKNVNQDNR